MGHLRKYLQWVGLLSSLLIVGVLGGLMAPLSSEAQTSVTVQVDSGAVSSISLSSCTIPSGYTACFQLATGGTYTGSNSRSYTIKNYGTSTPRLLMSDQSASGKDVLTLTTAEFAPTATAGWGSTAANTGCPTCSPPSYGEVHQLKIVVSHKFTVSNNKTVDTASRYAFALRASGMFKGLTGQNASGDFVKFEGDGIFGSTTTKTPLLSPFPSGAPACDLYNSKASPLDVNYCVLKRTMSVSTAQTSSFSTNPALEQVSPYPTYHCDNGNNGCTPTITLRLTATVNGPDSLILSSSADSIGGSCNLNSPDPGGGPSSNPALPCHSNGKKNFSNKITEYFDQQEAADLTAFLGENAEPTPACVEGQCLCLDPAVCKGTIVTNLRVTPATAEVFPFYGAGEGIPPSFAIPSDINGVGSLEFPDLSVGGGPWTIGAQLPWPQVGNGFWETDQIACASQLNTDTSTVTTFTIGSGPNGEKGPVTVNQLGAGDRLTCEWHIHKNSSN